MERNPSLEAIGRTPKVRKDKIARLKKAITNGTYRIRAGDVAGKILRDLVLQCALIPTAGEYARRKKE